jgi:hypothetical protein
VSKPERGSKKAELRRKRGFPWIPLILLLASIIVFWVLPTQLRERPVQVEFSQEKE